MSNGRAKKGGETGLNGEFYPGGTFLPSTTLAKGTSSAKAKPAKVRKARTGPSWEDYEIVPEGMRAIYASMMGFTGRWCQYSWKLELATSVIENEYNGLDMEGCRRLVEKFNAGERFCTEAEYKAMWKTGFKISN
jgi:hypothetical protein